MEIVAVSGETEFVHAGDRFPDLSEILRRLGADGWLLAAIDRETMKSEEVGLLTFAA